VSHTPARAIRRCPEQKETPFGRLMTARKLARPNPARKETAVTRTRGRMHRAVGAGDGNEKERVDWNRGR
jgi:hypothetical protein